MTQGYSAAGYFGDHNCCMQCHVASCLCDKTKAQTARWTTAG